MYILRKESKINVTCTGVHLHKLSKQTMDTGACEMTSFIGKVPMSLCHVFIFSQNFKEKGPWGHISPSGVILSTCSAKYNHLNYVGRGSLKDQLCEVLLSRVKQLIGKR